MRFEAEGSHLGYKFKVLINLVGNRCGYIQLPEGHPWYGKDYSDEAFNDVRVHGGLTFSAHVKNHPCLEDGFWIGFDCGHCFDLPDHDEMSKELRGTPVGKMLMGFGKGPKEIEDFIDNFHNAFLDILNIPDWERKDFEEGIKEMQKKRKVRGRWYVESECKNLIGFCEEVAKK